MGGGVGIRMALVRDFPELTGMEHYRKSAKASHDHESLITRIYLTYIISFQVSKISTEHL